MNDIIGEFSKVAFRPANTICLYFKIFYFGSVFNTLGGNFSFRYNTNIKIIIIHTWIFKHSIFCFNE